MSIKEEVINIFDAVTHVLHGLPIVRMYLVSVLSLNNIRIGY